MPEPQVREADLTDSTHGALIVGLLDAYVRDPMGGGRPLAEDVRARLPAALEAHPMIRVWLAFEAEDAIGLAVVIETFSTFAAAPVFNVHDLAVLEPQRGRGVGRALLGAVEQAARDRGCAKLTLEVLARNPRARGLYQSFGFEAHPPGDPDGKTFFFTKPLSP